MEMRRALAAKYSTHSFVDLELYRLKSLYDLRSTIADSMFEFAA